VNGFLREQGADKMLAKQREYLLSKQNDDGGFGEDVKADTDPSVSGIGPSTPTQTALALGALIMASPGDSIENDSAIARAVKFLLRTQKAGHWSPSRIATAVVGTDYYVTQHNTDLAALNALTLHDLARRFGVRSACAKMNAPTPHLRLTDCHTEIS
jgi:squalene cyclase